MIYDHGPTKPLFPISINLNAISNATGKHLRYDPAPSLRGTWQSSQFDILVNLFLGMQCVISLIPFGPISATDVPIGNTCIHFIHLRFQIAAENY
jgi:hypothetical protein